MDKINSACIHSKVMLVFLGSSSSTCPSPVHNDSSNDQTESTNSKKPGKLKRTARKTMTKNRSVREKELAMIAAFVKKHSAENDSKTVPVTSPVVSVTASTLPSNSVIITSNAAPVTAAATALVTRTESSNPITKRSDTIKSDGATSKLTSSVRFPSLQQKKGDSVPGNTSLVKVEPNGINDISEEQDRQLQLILARKKYEFAKQQSLIQAREPPRKTVETLIAEKAAAGLLASKSSTAIKSSPKVAASNEAITSQQPNGQVSLLRRDSNSAWPEKGSVPNKLESLIQTKVVPMVHADEVLRKTEVGNQQEKTSAVKPNSAGKNCANTSKTPAVATPAVSGSTEKSKVHEARTLLLPMVLTTTEPITSVKAIRTGATRVTVELDRATVFVAPKPQSCPAVIESDADAIAVGDESSNKSVIIGDGLTSDSTQLPNSRQSEKATENKMAGSASPVPGVGWEQESEKSSVAGSKPVSPGSKESGSPSSTFASEYLDSVLAGKALFDRNSQRESLANQKTDSDKLVTARQDQKTSVEKWSTSIKRFIGDNKKPTEPGKQHTK